MAVTADMQAHLDRLDQDGYTVLRGVIDLGLVDAIAEDLTRIERAAGTGPCTNAFEGFRTVRLYNLLARGSLYQHVPAHFGVLPLVERVLDPGLLVSSLSSIAIGPGEPAQPIHADDQMVPLARPHPPIICNTMWAITDFTENNGATRLVPGSHRSGQAPNPFDHHESVAAEMERGSVLVWVGSLWHGGGANRTGDRRVGIAMNYCAGFLRQQENQQLGLAPDLVSTFPRRLQELVGYSVYNGLIGHIDKMHPLKAVFGDVEGVRMVWDIAGPKS